MFASHTSFSTLASSTMPSNITTPTLVARMSIPTIGEVPSNDPIVYVSIIILCSMIVLALFLVCWTQRRSSKEVWASVAPNGQFRHLRNTTRFPVASERPSWDGSDEMEQDLVPRIHHNIPRADSEYSGSDTDSEIDAEEGDALANVQTPSHVHFSEPASAPYRSFTRTPVPLHSPAHDGFETVYDQFRASKMLETDSEDSDLGVSQKSVTLSRSEFQLHEMHLGGC